MADSRELSRVHYEQSAANYTREASLLFERLNFFVAAMAFLVLALVTLLTNAKWTYSFVTYAVATLALVVAGIFSVANIVADEVVLRIRNHLYDMERILSAINGDFGPHRHVFPRLDPQRTSPEDGEGKKRCWIPVWLRRVHWDIDRILDRPAVHTVVIPPLFYVFWIIILFYLARHSGPLSVVVTAILSILVTFVFICSCDIALQRV